MTINQILEQFEPEPDGLLREISAHTTDEVLERISRSDYGKDANLHLSALRHLRDTGTFEKAVHWVPAEVLELIRWSEPEDPEWEPGHTGELGHWMRAFCCAALLRATAEPWNYGDGIGTDSTLVQLVLSLDMLSIDFSLQAVKFLAWLLLQAHPQFMDQQVCAYGVGLFWCALKHPTHVVDEDLVQLADWILEQADVLYMKPTPPAHAPGTGDGLRLMVLSSQKASSWETLALKLFDLDLTSRSSMLQVSAQTIGGCLLC